MFFLFRQAKRLLKSLSSHFVWTISFSGWAKSSTFKSTVKNLKPLLKQRLMRCHNLRGSSHLILTIGHFPSLTLTPFSLQAKRAHSNSVPSVPFSFQSLIDRISRELRRGDTNVTTILIYYKPWASFPSSMPFWRNFCKNCKDIAQFLHS